MGKESKPARRLALEALAIFLGVTAGLLGDDYREYRSDREREREALQQLLQDLQIDSADIAPIQGHAAIRVEGMIRFNNGVAGADFDLSSMTSLLDTLSRSDLYSYEASNFTYSGLKASGRLDLIRDPSLRRDLVFYFEDRQPAMEVTNTGLLEADTRFFELLAKYIRRLPAETLVPWPHLRIRDPQALKNDGDLQHAGISLGSWSWWQADLAEQMLVLNVALTESIAEYLDRIGGTT